MPDAKGKAPWIVTLLYLGFVGWSLYGALVPVETYLFRMVHMAFIYALSFISVSAKKTISIGVPTELVRGDVFQWGPLMAGALLASIPVAVLYTFFLERFVAGFTMGAIK